MCGVLWPICRGILEVNFPKKDMVCPETDPDRCLCPGSQAGSADKSCPVFLYLEPRGDSSGLFLHAQPLKTDSGKKQQVSGPELFRYENVVSSSDGCPEEGHHSPAGEVGRHPFSQDS